jgi:hypothetical protein
MRHGLFEEGGGEAEDSKEGEDGEETGHGCFFFVYYL